jgi:DNA-binding CsgD family transcriptional regulator
MPPSVGLVAAPHRSAESSESGSTNVVPAVHRTAATKLALARLRSISANSELADRIPVELCGAGFGRVLFSLIRHNTWLVRSAHATGDEATMAELLEVGRAHPRRLAGTLPETAMVHTKAPILVEHPQSDPRVNTKLVEVVKPNAYIAAPVYVWQTPVALLHADAPTESGDVGPEDRDLLGVFAEGLGAIMERNIVMDRMRAVRSTALDHLRAVDSLTGLCDEEHAGSTAVSPEPPRASPRVGEGTANGVADQLTRRELQVLNLLAGGKTNAQIAGRLFISEGTVKSHLRRIMDKLNACNRTDAVARYRQMTRST